jgi:NAD(P)-dependent dehydrogenase (short-subunit alcohol dehydrogenase family)
MSDDIEDPKRGRNIVARALKEFGHIDISVNNAAYPDFVLL